MAQTLIDRLAARYEELQRAFFESGLVDGDNILARPPACEVTLAELLG